MRSCGAVWRWDSYRFPKVCIKVGRSHHGKEFLTSKLGKTQASFLLLLNNNFPMPFLQHTVYFAHSLQDNPNRSFLIMRNLDIADILRTIVVLSDELNVFVTNEFITGRVEENNRDMSVQSFQGYLIQVDVVLLCYSTGKGRSQHPCQ